MQNRRVLIASAHAPVRRLLTDVVRDEPGFTVVGEAGSEIEATALARRLEPEAVLVDFHLPHAIDLESVRLSRVSGLDTAMAIIDESRDARVILLTNLDDVILHGKVLIRGIARRMLVEIGGIKKAFTLRELCLEVPQAGALVYAHFEVTKRQPALGRSRAQRVLRNALLTLAGAFVLSHVAYLVIFLIGILLIAIAQ
ncbi:MAG: response regulator [Dehalococcoidia bacterium]|nr:MAG: response regulator [Dehalococcoidia bacterium]